MAFFRTVSFSETMPAILGDGISLRMPQTGDNVQAACLRQMQAVR